MAPRVDARRQLPAAVSYRPLRPRPPTANTRRTRGRLGKSGTEAKAPRKLRDLSPLQLDGRNHIIAKSHPAVGRPGRRPRASRGDTRARQRPQFRAPAGGRDRGARRRRRKVRRTRRQQVGSGRKATRGAEIERREGRAPRAEGAARGPDGTREGARQPAGPRGGSGDGGHWRLQRCPRGGQPHRGSLPCGCSTGPGGRKGAVCGHRVGPRVGPCSQSPGREAGRALCGQEAGSPTVTSGLAVTPRPPFPPHPFGSSNVGPKSLGPTTTNRRHRFGDQSAGAGVAAGGRGAHGRSSRGPRASAGLPAGAARSGLGSPTESGASTNQWPGEWEGPKFKFVGSS